MGRERSEEEYCIEITAKAESREAIEEATAAFITGTDWDANAEITEIEKNGTESWEAFIQAALQYREDELPSDVRDRLENEILPEVEDLSGADLSTADAAPAVSTFDNEPDVWPDDMDDDESELEDEEDNETVTLRELLYELDCREYEITVTFIGHSENGKYLVDDEWVCIGTVEEVLAKWNTFLVKENLPEKCVTDARWDTYEPLVLRELAGREAIFSGVPEKKEVEVTFDVPVRGGVRQDRATFIAWTLNELCDKWNEYRKCYKIRSHSVRTVTAKAL